MNCAAMEKRSSLVAIPSSRTASALSATTAETPHFRVALRPHQTKGRAGPAPVTTNQRGPIVKT